MLNKIVEEGTITYPAKAANVLLTVFNQDMTWLSLVFPCCTVTLLGLGHTVVGKACSRDSKESIHAYTSV